MSVLQSKKSFAAISILFTFTYMISYITRINFGAIVSEMEAATDVPRSLLSMSLTGSFITYGAGQVVSGVLGDRFSPKKLVLLGLIVSVSMNILIPFCQNPYQMLFVWCINGFAQSFMWPPMVRLMSSLLSQDDYNKCSVQVSWGSSFGTIAVYLFSPLIISLSGWKGVFLFSAFCGIVMIFFWQKFARDIPLEQKKESSEPGCTKNVLFTPLMICVMLAIILQGMLRDGVTTWMPSYISETYNLSRIISILTGIILPIFSIVAFNLSSRLYRKTFTNPILCAGVLFGAGTLSSLCLCLLSGQNAVYSVLFSALLTGCMHGVNLILICMVPPFFKRYGNISTVSGVINSCTYIGSALSTYGIALISEKMGWSFTLFTWLLIAALGTLICFAAAKPWHKKMQTD